MKKHIAFPHWLILVLILFISSCAPSIVLWNQATENFNQGVSLETENRFANRMQSAGEELPPPEAVPDVNKLLGGSSEVVGESPQELFKKADEQISKALDAPAPLKKEGKLANARFLKALIAWKTGQAEAARANAALALQEFQNQEDTSPRDEALARAIPGLVALDEVYVMTQPMIQQLKEKSANASEMSEADKKALFSEASDMYEKINDGSSLTSLAGARADFNAAIMKATENKEVITYLLLCEMSGLKNQYDFWSSLDNFAKRTSLKVNDTEIRNWLDSEEESYLEFKNAALERLKESVEGGASHPAYRYWDRIL